MFSSLNGMLPESREFLVGAGWSEELAASVTMACFIAGFVGIQAVSRLLHLLMPSHVVDCDHSHNDQPPDMGYAHVHYHAHSRASRAQHREPHKSPSRGHSSKVSDIAGNGDGRLTETTPLLSPPAMRPSSCNSSAGGDEMAQRAKSSLTSRGRPADTGTGSVARRPSIFHVQQRVMSFVKDTKCNCSETGSCYGFTDPCGQECFKHLSNHRPSYNPRHSTFLRTTTGPLYPNNDYTFHGADALESCEDERPMSPRFRTSRAASRELAESPEEGDGSDCAYESGPDDELNHHDHDHGHHDHHRYENGRHEHEEDVEAQHHHHVPTNAFLSISLQTSIAIALHKFPEGFITYATNHANPALGFNIFMALFVHNISEGFAMALPLYMALNSRWRAMAWCTLLGGASQPLGAGIAVLWFKVAKKTHLTPNAVVYACIFAITAGIMVSVALQLFVESLSLNHNRNLCIFFGFIGMVILGISNAIFVE